MKQIITILSLLFVATFANAQQITNGLLDDSFGTQGVAIANAGGNPYYVETTATALQPDGRIVMVGTLDSSNRHVAFAMRFNNDGTRDMTFANGGYAGTVIGLTMDSIVAIALQADGKIVAAGFTNQFPSQIENLLILRFDSTGVLDHTFGTNGRLVISSSSLSLRLWGVAIQNDQKIVLAGGGQTAASGPDAFLLVRLTTTGAFDNTFGSSGVTTTSFFGFGADAFAITIQPDQKIVLAGLAETSAPVIGENYDNTALARYTTTGALDNTFGTNGTTTLGLSNGGDLVTAVGLQSTGAILVAGAGFDVIKFNTGGVVDSSFGYQGVAGVSFQQQSNQSYGMAIGPDDYIALTGSTITATGAQLAAAATAYLNPDGTPDQSWGTQGMAITPNLTNGNNIPFNVLIQPDKKILIAGEGFQPGAERVWMERYYISPPVQPNSIHNIADNLFSLYPNPAYNEIRIQLTGANAFSNYTVYDALGRTALTGNMQGMQQLLDVSNLPAGVYLLRLSAGDKEAAKRFVVGR